ncbi:hypothetical protein L1987_17560 [Smallanthus sonchifolius]|uniref:Uncharacterized protein n=1 Tax=Smallanthus sonchifolius TaxID=185202 RepID=A0ACB9J0Q9_9ASTR|nr:hypothetical protein L1987_17560 [Smallanthus sonchifolius]
MSIAGKFAYFPSELHIYPTIQLVGNAKIVNLAPLRAYPFDHPTSTHINSESLIDTHFIKLRSCLNVLTIFAGHPCLGIHRFNKKE